MNNENLDTTNKLIRPEDISPSDDAIIRQLSDNLQDITPEDVNSMCDEMMEAERNQKEKKMKEEDQKKIEEEQKKEMALQELMEYRESWQGIDLDDSAMDLITEAVEEIPLTIKVDSDGSRLIEFKLGDKTYKILDPKIKDHSDPEYFEDTKYSFIGERDEWVELGGMVGDDINDWENQKLKKYIKQKKKEGLHIPKIEEIEKLLEELGDFADLWDEDEEIAMLMYLTGIDGRYWLSMGTDLESGNDYSSRTILKCDDIERGFDSSDDETDIASLLMISCKGDDESESERYVEEDDEDDDEFL